MTDPLVTLAESVADDSVESREGARSLLESLDAARLAATADELLDAVDAAPDAEQRRAAVRGLSALAQVRPEALPPLPTVLANLLDADDRTIRFAAAATLQQLEPDADTLHRALTASEPERRRAAIRYYDYCGLTEHDFATDEVAAALAARLDDEDGEVRRLAARLYRRAAERDSEERFSHRRGSPVDPLFEPALEPLSAAASAGDSRLALHASLALLSLSRNWGFDGYTSAAETAFARMLTHSEERTRRDAKRALVARELPTEALLALLTAAEHYRDAGTAAELVDRNPRYDKAAALLGDETTDALERAIPRAVESQGDAVAEVLDRVVARGWTDPSPNPLARLAVWTLATESPAAVAGVADELLGGMQDDRGIREGLETLGALADADELPEESTVVAEAVATARESGADVPVATIARVALAAPGAFDAAPELERVAAAGPEDAAVGDDEFLTALRGLAAVSEVTPSAVESVDSVEDRLLERVFDPEYLSRDPAGALVSLWQGFPDRIQCDPEEVRRRLEEDRPAVAVAGADSRIAESALERLCDALAAGSDNHHDIMCSLADIAAARPETVVPSVDPIVAERPTQSRSTGSRRRLAELLDSVAAVAPDAVVPHADVLVGLFTDESPEVRGAATGALVRLGSGGHDLPYGLERLAEVDREAPGWPMGVAAETAPELARQLLRTALVNIDEGQREHAELIAQVAQGHRELALDAVDHAAAYAGLNEHSDHAGSDIYAEILAGLATRDISLVESAVPVIVDAALHIDDGHPSSIERGNPPLLAQALVAVSDAYPGATRHAITAVLHEDESLADRATAFYTDEFEQVAESLALDPDDSAASDHENYTSENRIERDATLATVLENRL